MWEFLRSLFTPPAAHSGSLSSTSETWFLCDGKSVRADEAFFAATSQELPRMQSALEVKNNEIDRFFSILRAAEFLTLRVQIPNRRLYKLRRDALAS